MFPLPPPWPMRLTGDFLELLVVTKDPNHVLRKLLPKARRVYLSIYEIYITPLQGNYSEAPPAQCRAKIKVVRSL